MCRNAMSMLGSPGPTEEGLFGYPGSKKIGQLIRYPWLDMGKLNVAWPVLTELIQACKNAIEIYAPRVVVDGPQDGEDKILRGILPELGTYIDIGAGEPFECSNTGWLYRKGWRGLLVEPLPWRIPALNLWRTGDMVLPVAVMDYDGAVPIRVSGSCSSIDPHWNISESGTILVPCRRLDTIANKCFWFESIDFCSIDVEGAERKVLSSISWDSFQPKALCIEYRRYNPTELGEDISDEWLPILEPYYREVGRTKFNIIFTRKA